MEDSTDKYSSWLGWVGFASFMLMLGGIFSVIAGFVALFNSEVVYSAYTQTLWIFDYTQWGWAHIIVGSMAILAAGSLLAGNMYGRVIAILVALISAVANMAFVPVYPFWSIMIITIDILVIYAVAVHGGKLKEVRA